MASPGTEERDEDKDRKLLSKVGRTVLRAESRLAIKRERCLMLERPPVSLVRARNICLHDASG